MTTFAKMFSEEIRRLARKEIRAAVSDLQSTNRKLKQANSQLQKRLAGMERQLKKVAEGKLTTAKSVSKVEDALEQKVRITAKGIRSLRARWGVSQTDFARILGVSSQSIVNWEAKEGAISLRSRPRQAYLELRHIGARDARKLLDEMDGSTAKTAE